MEGEDTASAWTRIDSACRVSNHGQTRPSKQKQQKACSPRSPPFSEHRPTTRVVPNQAGGVSMAPGRNATRVILADLGMDFNSDI
jgi:hypothetical protein